MTLNELQMKLDKREREQRIRKKEEVKKDETLIYSDFKKVNGLVMPFRIEANTPKKEGDYVMILNRIDTNKAFPENTFKF